MKIIGVSGFIGAGKSTMLDYLSQNKNIKVFEADKISKLVLYDKAVINFLKKEIPNSLEKNIINKTILRQKVFNDHNLNDKFTKIVWPLISNKIKDMITELNNGYDLVFVEAAIISGLDIKFDKTIFLIKENYKRIESVQSRDKINQNEIDSITNFQKEKLKNYKFDFILENNSNKDKFYHDIDILIDKISSS